MRERSTTIRPTPAAASPAPAASRPLSYGLAFAAWTVVGLFLAGPMLLERVAAGEPPDWAYVILTFVSAYTWAPLTPFAHRVLQRHPVAAIREGGRPLRAHAGVFLVIVVCDTATTVIANRLLDAAGLLQAEPLLEDIAVTGITFAAASFLWYTGMIAVLTAVDGYGRMQERDLHASRLSARLAEAQLQLLQMQLHPHFLFNALHTASALLAEDPPAARRVLSRLGELFRLALENSGEPEVPLRDELAFLEAYLDIERTRYQDRLTVVFDVAAETLPALLPSLVLQPLAENAVRHGVGRRSTPGRIEILARRRDDRLVLQVRDDGPGLAGATDAAPRRREGIGLANTRSRLQQLYGAGQRFNLYDAAEGGLRVIVEIPFRTRTAGTSPAVALPHLVPEHELA